MSMSCTAPDTIKTRITARYSYSGKNLKPPLYGKKLQKSVTSTTCTAIARDSRYVPLTVAGLP